MSTVTPDDRESPLIADRTPGLRGACDPDARTWGRGMLESIADKWTILVVEALAHGTKRFTAVQAAVPGISHRMLTRTLRHLERDGMLTRTVYAEVPPRVDYELTALGQTLITPVDGFIRWAEEHRDIVDQKRQEFDAR